ncbi:MAG TPA: glucose-1-phosphate adenylyltransferase [Bacteroidota bacterium]|jgi:glucose-1-phosphate adenylyltransferase|nr:glucose-1-phosphate adenylyltransferase [Bacteroidota bacterium]
MNNVLTMILGGGRGERLYPLTKHRAKPALPLAGKYRLIDIPVSNCINSGMLKIFVITQFNSASLNRHIADTYRFAPFIRGFVDVLAAQQTPQSPDWFEGTADAVRKTLWVTDPWQVDEYLILSGDHLYRMDYRLFLQHHLETNADVTLSVVPVDEARASGFGLLDINEQGRVVDFKEKPKGDALRAMQVDTQRLGLEPVSAAHMPYAASMGIYLFKQNVLKELLKIPGHKDFGHDIIPAAIHTRNVQAYLFKGYWEDIGTIETFYKANLGLVKQPKPSFSFFDVEFPIYTHARFLPPSKVLDCAMQETMICDGCIVKTGEVKNSIIGIRARLEDNVTIHDTLVMGADYYQSDLERGNDLISGIPSVGIGANSVIRKAIIDKNARIGKNVKIINNANARKAECEQEGYWIRGGIVVVMKNAVIPDGTVI